MRVVPAIAVLVLFIFVSSCAGRHITSGNEPGSITPLGPDEEDESPAAPPAENPIGNQSPPGHEEESPPPSVPGQSSLTTWAKEEGVRIGGVSSCTLFKGNEYWMYYTGMGIELATSSDGLDFDYKGGLIDARDVEGTDMVTNPAVFETQDGRYRMIFEGSRMDYNKNDRRLYSAVSSDGVAWTVEEGVRFQDEGDGKPGELFTSVPDIIRLGDRRLRMYYTRGVTSATALSSDDGLTWTKETNLKLTKVALDPDIVVLDDGTYKLFFTTFEDEFGKGEQWVVAASSSDGIEFVLDEGKLIEPGTAGGLVTDPDVVRLDTGYRMYYGEFKAGEAGPYGSEPSILSAFSEG